MKDVHDFVENSLVCYTAVFRVVTQCSPLREEWGGALRDDTKNGSVAD